MTLTFSDVYAPLFDLLEARSVVSGSDFDKYTKPQQDYWISLSKVDTVLLSGGRDGGKSFALSCFNVIASCDYGHRILYTRQTMSSTDNSITEAIENRIESMGYGNRFNVANKIYEVSNGLGKISITGQKTSVGTQTAKLKSLEDFSIFETEEGEELESFDNWKKVKRSMRAKDVQTLSIIVFNPPTNEHWLYTEFYEGVPDFYNGIKGKTLYIHSTYLDNGRENMTESNWEEYEGLRKDYEIYLSTEVSKRDSLSYRTIKNYEEYKFKILGSFKNRAEGVVFENWKTGQFNPDNLQTGFGQDYGFSSDPTSLVEVAIDKKKKIIYCKEHLYKPKLSTEQISVINKSVCKERLIIADSAEPRLIFELQSKGCLILGAVKGQGSISVGIMHLLDYELIIDPSSLNLIKELNNFIYADKGAKLYVDKWNHLIDAIRYYVTYYLSMGEVDIR